MESEVQPWLQLAFQYWRSEAKESPTILEALSAALPCITGALGTELYLFPLRGPKTIKMLSRAMETKTTIGSTKSCFLFCFEEKVAISKFSFRFRLINNIPQLIVARNANFYWKSVYFSELILPAYKRVMYPSYRKYSPATSCAWGIFVSATWGRNVIARMAVLWYRCKMQMRSPSTNDCLCSDILNQLREIFFVWLTEYKMPHRSGIIKHQPKIADREVGPAGFEPATKRLWVACANHCAMGPNSY